MAKMIQIRNVPDALHRKLKVQAAERGQSLSDYLLNEIQHLALRPSLEQLVERIAKRTPIPLDQGAAELIREIRDERDRDWETREGRDRG
jgi:plasmid stability protein